MTDFILRHAEKLVVGIVVLAVFLVVVSGASAGKPSQHIAEQRASLAVDSLCGGGWLMCVKRYPVRVFFNCGSSAVCWRTCYTHVEKPVIGKRRFKCSTGQIKYRSGHLTYYYEF